MERANKTLQDRLVKELRLRGIGTMEAANAFLPSDYSQRFANRRMLAFSPPFHIKLRGPIQTERPAAIQVM